MTKHPEDNANQDKLFQHFPLPDDGPWVTRIVGEEPTIEMKSVKPRIDTAQRAIFLKGAAKSAKSFIKGDRMKNLPDFAIIQRGYDPETVQNNMRENYNQMAIKLAEASIRCIYHQDGSCEIDCEPQEWLSRFHTSKTLDNLVKRTSNPKERC